jgi:hypothetical protein
MPKSENRSDSEKKIGSWKIMPVVRIGEERYAHATESDDNGQGKQKGWKDSGKSPNIEGSPVDIFQGTEAKQRVRRNQIPRDHKKHRHPVISIPQYRAKNVLPKKISDGAVKQAESQAEVQQHHQQNRNST